MSDSLGSMHNGRDAPPINYDQRALAGSGGWSLFRARRNKLRYFIINISLLALTGLFYQWSLTGAEDLESMNKLLPTIAQYVVACMALAYAHLVTLFVFPFSKFEKAGLAICTFVYYAANLFSDDGYFFDHHGSYNRIAFLATYLPFLGLCVTVAVLKCIFKKTSTSRLICYLFLSFIALLLLDYGVSVGTLYRGILPGQAVKNDAPLCRIDTSYIPWYDMVPAKLHNFWVGNDACKKEKTFAKFDDQGRLHIDCSVFSHHGRHHHKLPARYLEIPDKRNMTAHERAKLRDSVVSRFHEKPYPDDGRPVETTAEAVVAMCGEHHKNFLSRVVKNETMVKEKRRSAQPTATGGSSAPNKRKPLKTLVLWIDSTSRYMFMRRLPKSTRTVRDIATKKKAHVYEFFRYNAIAGHTAPNARSMFMGDNTFQDLSFETLWRSNISAQIRKTPIWQDFGAKGYVTTRADDICEDWSAAQMNQPENEVYNEFDHELITLFCHPDYLTKDVGYLWQGPYAVKRRCLGKDMVHTHVFNYLEQSFAQYHDLPQFSIGGFIEAHEPTSTVLATLDDDLSDFLARVVTPLLDDTIVFIVADHGLHMGLIKLVTEAGRVEHALPLMMMMAPNWFMEQNPQFARNLHDNQQNLVTAFDFYRTLKHILAFPEPAPSNATDPQVPAYAFSLFDEIPKDRTCETAMIRPEWCRCH